MSPKRKKKEVELTEAVSQIEAEEEAHSIDFTDEAEPTAEEIKAHEQSVEDDRPMNRQHPKWTEYVLSLIPDGELFLNEDSTLGMPKAETFRWLVEELIGKIISTKLDINYHVNPTNGKVNAIAVVHAAVDEYEYDEVREYSAAADANYSNGGGFENYLTATAETRAKGRLYREILRLKNVITAEELGDKDKTELIKKADESVEHSNPGQQMMIRRLTKESNIDLNKFMRKVLEKEVDVSELTGAEARKLMVEINKYRSDSSKIPAEILIGENDA